MVAHGSTYYLNRSHGTDVPDQNDNGDLLAVDRAERQHGHPRHTGAAHRAGRTRGPPLLVRVHDVRRRMVYATPAF
ncbi:hypothetical protein [Asanoa sp. NPDC050611]|uniref:hypothetical protein n=1 Tax=Asanoa sp. NPDC050611 TaxID=3157098 RepID=UPI0033C8F532